jgi:hypothetical protein
LSQPSVVPPVTTIAAVVPETTPETASSSITGARVQPGKDHIVRTPPAASVDTPPITTPEPPSMYEPLHPRPRF